MFGYGGYSSYYGYSPYSSFYGGYGNYGYGYGSGYYPSSIVVINNDGNSGFVHGKRGVRGGSDTYYDVARSRGAVANNGGASTGGRVASNSYYDRSWRNSIPQSSQTQTRSYYNNGGASRSSWDSGNGRQSSSDSFGNNNSRSSFNYGNSNGGFGGGNRSSGGFSTGGGGSSSGGGGGGGGRSRH